MNRATSSKSVHSNRTNSTLAQHNNDEDKFSPGTSVSTSTIDADDQSQLTTAHPSTASTIGMGSKIRKNLDRKKQTRPKIDEMAPNRPKTVVVSTNNTPPASKYIEGLDIPRRTSLLEYVEADMAKLGQKAVMYRFLAIGSHGEDPKEFMALHERMIEVINMACYDEPATGYLMVYPNHFTHLLEGSELTINKYIAMCAEHFQGFAQSHIETDFHPKSDKIYTVRMIILNYVMARERYTSEWYHVIHLTPSNRGLMHYKGFRKRLFEFIKNIWVLAGVLAESYTREKLPETEDLSNEDAILEVLEEQELYRQIQEKLYTLFPGLDMLNYFLKEKKRIPQLRTPQQHIIKFWTVPNIILDSETTWPIPCRLAPYH